MGVFRSLVVGVATALACAPAALADSARSTNWAGYAVHGSGVSYRSVQGSWVEPGASCTRGAPTFSSYWVGIGGYSASAQALEQIGTEADCNPLGQVVTSTWYELVPRPSVRIRLRVRAGDVMQASVSVKGKAVSLSLFDVTRNQGFRKRVNASALDLASAEWIAEAPSECIDAGSCQPLPLANFGSVTFNSAAAQSSGGRSGSISSPAWTATKINLRPNSRRYIVNTSSGPAIGTAVPSGLQSGGSSFTVAYTPVLVAGGSVFAIKASTSRAGHIVHPRF